MENKCSLVETTGEIVYNMAVLAKPNLNKSEELEFKKEIQRNKRYLQDKKNKSILVKWFKRKPHVVTDVEAEADLSAESDSWNFWSLRVYDFKARDIIDNYNRQSVRECGKIFVTLKDWRCLYYYANWKETD